MIDEANADRMPAASMRCFNVLRGMPRGLDVRLATPRAVPMLRMHLAGDESRGTGLGALRDRAVNDQWALPSGNPEGDGRFASTFPVAISRPQIAYRVQISRGEPATGIITVQPADCLRVASLKQAD
jgi:hypothetical protein